MSNFGLDPEELAGEIHAAVDPDMIAAHIRESLAHVDRIKADLTGTARTMRDDDEEESWSEDETDDHTIEHRFDVGNNPEFSISNVSGRITIQTGEMGSISVRATKRGTSRRRRATRVEITQTGDAVWVQTKSSTDGLMNLTHSISSVDYDVLVPAGCRVRVRSVSGDVSISGTNAPVEVRTVSGAASVSASSGECSITTVSGSINGYDVSGALTIHTTSGRAKLEAAQLDRFHLQSVSGGFTITTSLTHGAHYFAKTVSGGLRLIIPTTTGATVQMKTVSGAVECELPAEIIKANRRTWQGMINGGGAHLEMHSVSGALRIQGGDSEQQASSSIEAEAEPAKAEQARTDMDPPAEPDDWTHAILKALERGEISVDEAMAKLDEPR